jgi:uncharacterized protein involved in outer membrane biogenesis
MRRILKCGLFAVLVAVAAGAGGIAYIRKIDVDRFRPALVAELRQATDREVAADGPLRLALWPPRFTLSAVAIANARWGTRPAFADVERVEGYISLRALLHGEIRIARLKLVQPDLWFETDPFGKVNWVLAGGRPPGTGEGSRFSLNEMLAVDRVDVAGGRLTYRDGATGDITVVSIASATAEGVDPGAPLMVTFAGDWNALPIRLRGALGAYNAIASDDGNATEVRLALEAAGATLFVEGTVGDPRAGPGSKLHISGKAAALDGIAAMSGLALPRATPVSLDADLRYRRARLELSAIHLAIGEQAAAGGLSVDFAGARPVVAADIAATGIDLTRLAAGPADARAAVLSSEAGLMEALVSSGVLTAVDGKADVRADTLRAGPLLLHDAEAHVVLKDGDLLAEPVRARSVGGAMEGSFRVAGAAVPARLSLSLRAPALAIGPALQQLGTVKAFGGVMSVAANLSTVAGSPETMLAALQGEALVAMGEGRLTLEPYTAPFDISAAGLGGLVALIAEDGRQDVTLECLAGRMTVDGGVASTEGFVVLTGDARLKGEGTIDLGAGRLALRFIPETRGGKLIVGDSVAVGGSFADPRLSLEPGAANASAFSDVALYPVRRFFASLAAEPAANACLRGLPPAPRKRALPGREPVAEARRGDVQEAVAPRAASEPEAPIGNRAE